MNALANIHFVFKCKLYVFGTLWSSNKKYYIININNFQVEQTIHLLKQNTAGYTGCKLQSRGQGVRPSVQGMKNPACKVPAHCGQCFFFQNYIECFLDSLIQKRLF